MIDASVLGALVFKEPQAEEASALLRGAELNAPWLLAYELAHIAQKKIGEFPEQLDTFQEALEAALQMERAGKNNDLGISRNQFETLNNEYQRARTELQKLIS